MNNKTTKGKVIIITGKTGTGKTQLVSNVISELLKSKINVKGIFSPGRFEKGIKTGILLRDIATQETRLLGVYQPGWDADMPKREWKMDIETLQWGDEILKNSVPASVLIIDELGFLEFEKNQGLISAFEVIEKGTFDIAIVVVRKSLLNLALRKWKKANFIEIEELSDLKKTTEYLIDQVLDILDK